MIPSGRRWMGRDYKSPLGCSPLSPTLSPLNLILQPSMGSISIMQFSIFKVLSAFLFLTSLVSLSTLAHPTPYSHLTSQATASPALVEIIHEFPLGTWVENLAVRKNGQILASILTTPEIYLVDPSQQPPTAALVATFPALGCLGIAEVKPDLFYVITGTSLSTPSQTPQAPIPYGRST